MPYQHTPQNSRDVPKSKVLRAAKGNRSIAPDQVRDCPPRIERALLEPDALSYNEVIALQRKLGNRILHALLGRQEQLPHFRTELHVGAENTPSEHEADRMAGHVVEQAHTGSGRGVSRPVQDRKSVSEQVKTHERSRWPRGSFATPHMVPKLPASSADGSTVSGELADSFRQRQGHGHSLPEPVKANMEAAFEADFSAVRVHADEQADTLNRSLHARAFTFGQDIFFRHEAFNSTSRTGQELLAHELTHVVQQQSYTSTGNAPLIQRAPAYSGTFPQSVDQASVTTVVADLLRWISAFEERWGEKAKLNTLKTQLGLLGAQADRGVAILNAKLQDIKTLLRTVQNEVETTAVPVDELSKTDKLQAEEPKYVEIPGSNALDDMLRAAAGNPTTSTLVPPAAWTTQPIEIAVSDPAVPEMLRVLIRFIATADSAVGLEYRVPNKPEVDADQPRMAPALVAEARGPFNQRGAREFEKAHFGLVRSWHLDEKNRFPHPQDTALTTARQGGGSSAEYLLANEADFSVELGVPDKLRSNDLKAVGLAEFNTPKLGANGRLVYDYLNRVFYFTPDHYNEWTSAITGATKLFSFFKLTGTDHMLLTCSGAKELQRLRYWENQRRGGRATIK
jgi:hypothetical protein